MAEDRAGHKTSPQVEAAQDSYRLWRWRYALEDLDRAARSWNPEKAASYRPLLMAWQNAKRHLSEKGVTKLEKPLKDWVKEVRARSSLAKESSSAKAGKRKQRRETKPLIFSLLEELQDWIAKRLAAIPRSPQKADGFLRATAGHASLLRPREYPALLYGAGRWSEVGAKRARMAQGWQELAQRNFERTAEVHTWCRGRAELVVVKREPSVERMKPFWNYADGSKPESSIVMLWTWQDLKFQELDWFFIPQCKKLVENLQSTYDQPAVDLLWLVSRSPGVWHRVEPAAVALVYRLRELQAKGDSFPCRVFDTYGLPDPLTTAQAVLCMQHCPSLVSPEQLARCAQWLRDKQLPTGGWLRVPSRWGQGEDLLTTCLAVKAICECGRGDFTDSVNKGKDWILTQQNPLGYWASEGEEFVREFMTVLAQEALEAADDYVHRPSGREGAEGEGNVFRLRGDYWIVSYEGTKPVPLEDRKGLHYIAYLLKRPGEQIQCLKLRRAVEGAPPTEVPGVTSAKEQPETEEPAPRGPLPGVGVDDVSEWDTLKNYRDHLVGIRAELERAKTDNDEARRQQLEQEKAEVIGEIRRITNLDGGIRRFHTHREKARKAVCAAISRAKERIGKDLPELERHLGRTLWTGSSCSYSPSPNVEWHT